MNFVGVVLVREVLENKAEEESALYCARRCSFLSFDAAAAAAAGVSYVGLLARS